MPNGHPPTPQCKGTENMTEVNSNEPQKQEVDPLEEFAVEPEQGQPTQTAEEDDVPEKYRGKSVKELVAILQEQEKFAGRQSTEVGELRKLIDDVILARDKQDTPAQQTSDDEIDEMEWYTNPQSVVEKVVQRKLETDPRLKAAVDGVQNLTKREVVEMLMEKHPDAAQITQEPQFVAWVKESPVRIDLFNRAGQYDFAAADELYTLYKAIHGKGKKDSKDNPHFKGPSVKDAATGDTRGSASSSSKIYRREDIVKLMKTDPARYKQLLPEITRAYAEKRVR